MQKLAEICIRRPVFAMMIVLTLVVLGVAGYVNLGVDRFPSVDLPVVRISASLPGASPAEMESQVAQPIEEVVNTIEGINELRSVNGAGNAFVVAPSISIATLTSQRRTCATAWHPSPASCRGT